MSRVVEEEVVGEVIEEEMVGEAVVKDVVVEEEAVMDKVMVEVEEEGVGEGGGDIDHILT